MHTRIFSQHARAVAKAKKIPGAYISATPKNVLAMGYRPVRTPLARLRRTAADLEPRRPQDGTMTQYRPMLEPSRLSTSSPTPPSRRCARRANGIPCSLGALFASLLLTFADFWFTQNRPTSPSHPPRFLHDRSLHPSRQRLLSPSLGHARLGAQAALPSRGGAKKEAEATSEAY